MILRKRGHRKRREQLAHEILDWLKSTAALGDVVLVGSRDSLSRMIQLSSRSEFSHAAIVADRYRVIEAYDYTLSVAEDDEGLYEESFSNFVRRYPQISHLALFRHVDADSDHTAWQAKRLYHRSPTYPTLGVATIGLALWTERALRHPPTTSPFDHHRAIRWQALFVADGPVRMSCAELITRVTDAAKAPITFVRPLLHRHIDVVDEDAKTPDGYESDDLILPSGQPRLLSVRGRRRRRRAPTARAAITASAEAATNLRSAWQARLESALPGDIADFILPEDLTQTDELIRVAALHVTSTGRIVYEYGPRPDDPLSELGPQRRHLHGT